MKTNRTADSIVEELITSIEESYYELKNDMSEMAFGQRLAYLECLSFIRSAVICDADKFGLDCDLDEKYEIYKYMKKKD